MCECLAPVFFYGLHELIFAPGAPLTSMMPNVWSMFLPASFEQTGRMTLPHRSYSWMWNLSMRCSLVTFFMASTFTLPRSWMYTGRPCDRHAHTHVFASLHLSPVYGCTNSPRHSRKHMQALKRRRSFADCACPQQSLCIMHIGQREQITSKP